MSVGGGDRSPPAAERSEVSIRSDFTFVVVTPTSAHESLSSMPGRYDLGLLCRPRVGHDVQHVNDYEAAILAAAVFKPNLVLLDIGIPSSMVMRLVVASAPSRAAPELRSRHSGRCCRHVPGLDLAAKVFRFVGIGTADNFVLRQ